MKTFKEKKEELLKLIRGKKLKYKRLALSPIRYAGGKSLAVGHIVELFPDDLTKIVSPFFGGGSLEIASSQILGLEVIGYDIFNILVNYWNYQINYPDLLADKLATIPVDAQTYTKIRLILKDVWDKKLELDNLTLAAYYYYNFNMSYGPGFMGWASKVYLKEDKYLSMVEKVRNFKPGNLQVYESDFINIMEKHRDDFLYLDPPYFLDGDSEMFRGIYPMRNIPVHHNGFPHEKLRDLLKQHRGGFILSYNNCEASREYYKEYEQFFPEWQYTMGQGETRIGEHREETQTHIKKSHEIMIYCPPKNRKEILIK